MFLKNFLGRGLVPGSVLVLGLFLTSCLKDKDNSEQSAAGVMSFNLAPDQNAVGVSLSGNMLGNRAIQYGSYTPYLNVFAGTRLVESFETSGMQRLDSTTHTFYPGKYYSIFVVGSAGNYRNVVSHDDFDSLTASSGKAYLRYVNALSNAPTSTVTIQSGGADVVHAQAAFGEVSGFVGVNPGDVSVNVSNEAAQANRTISLQGSKAYTILLMGLPNQSDSVKAVQVRFIENGTVTD